MAVKQYKRSEKLKLSKNFTLDEFKCKCGRCDPILVDDALVVWLQKIRDHFGKAVTINSGYRCPKHNASAKVGGSPYSHHVKGMAADIRLDGVTPAEVAKYAESVGIMRIGLYDTFVHIGSDPTKGFWLGHEKTKVETFGGAVKKTVSLELPILQKGNKSSVVRALQQLLVAEGYSIVIDGSFGSKTRNALECYQEDMDIEATGICDEATWHCLLGVEI